MSVFRQLIYRPTVLPQPNVFSTGYTGFQYQNGGNILQCDIDLVNIIVSTNADIEITSTTKGVIMTDRVDGHRYRIFMAGGKLKTELA